MFYRFCFWSTGLISMDIDNLVGLKSTLAHRYQTNYCLFPISLNLFFFFSWNSLLVVSYITLWVCKINGHVLTFLCLCQKVISPRYIFRKSTANIEKRVCKLEQLGYCTFIIFSLSNMYLTVLQLNIGCSFSIKVEYE